MACASITAHVSRTATIIVLALGATVAGFAIATSATHLRGSDSPASPSVAAAPQSATLDWRETYGTSPEQIVFTVRSLEVTNSGWSAHIGIENDSKLGWELAPGASPDGTFGLQLFETGDAQELNARNRTNTLPAVRAATSYAPTLPRILEPKASWEGEISAPGALVAGSWARVVFGTLIAVGKPPPNMNDVVVWITDSAYELKA
jgi:hypothetical protein